TALGVDGVGDLAPAGNLFGGVDPGRAGVALCGLGDLGCLGHDEARAGALCVILCRERTRNIALERPAARERRHGDAVAEFHVADANWLEQGLLRTLFLLGHPGILLWGQAGETAPGERTLRRNIAAIASSIPKFVQMQRRW